jgi:hypothetical protein
MSVAPIDVAAYKCYRCEEVMPIEIFLDYCEVCRRPAAPLVTGDAPCSACGMPLIVDERRYLENDS